MAEFQKERSLSTPAQPRGDHHKSKDISSWRELIAELDGEEAAAQFLIDQKTEEKPRETVESIDELKAQIGGLSETWATKLKKKVNQIKQKRALHQLKKNPDPEALHLRDRMDRITSELGELNQTWGYEEEIRLTKLGSEIKVDPKDLSRAQFGGHDLLLEQPDIIHEIEDLLPEIKPKTDTIDFESSLDVVLVNLVDHHHQERAIELWEVSERQGIRKHTIAGGDIHNPFMKAMRYALAREAEVSLQEVTDPTKQACLAKHIEQRFARTNPSFFATCIIRMNDIFPRYDVDENGSLTGISSEYKRILKKLLDANQEMATRQIVGSIINPSSYFSPDNLHRISANLDPVLRKQLFQTCLNRDGIQLLINDNGFFKTEIDSMEEDERIASFALMNAQVTELIGSGYSFFCFLKKLSLTMEQEEVFINLLLDKGYRERLMNAIFLFSTKIQINIVKRCNQSTLSILASLLPYMDCRKERKLDSVIAEQLIKNGFTEDVAKNFEVFDDLPQEVMRRLESYRTLSKKIKESPSRTVRRMQVALIQELSVSAEPEKTYDRIEAIFLRNHIPLAGKVFLTFEAVYGDSRIHAAYSPTLKESSPREARMLIYKDLLNIHLDTGNPSFREYLKELKEMLPLFERITDGNEESLEKEEVKNVTEFFRKATVLREVSTYAKIHPRSVNETGSLRTQLEEWKQSLGVRAGQSLIARLEEMFLRPAGIKSIDEALARMDQSKNRADTINRELVKSTDGVLKLQLGDLLKGVQSTFFLSFLQNGNVAKEYLGYAADNDATPLDTDVSRVVKSDLSKGNESALKRSLVHDYGDIVLVMRPTAHRFYEKKSREPTHVHKQIRGQLPPYELFNTRVLDPERHYAIRTGVPFSEVRWIILKDPKRREMLDLQMDIVANGYYVAITNLAGEILFSPEEFDQLKMLYAGSDLYPGSDFPLERDLSTDAEHKTLKRLQKQIFQERPKIKKIKNEIEKALQEALLRVGIPLRVSKELAMGAEIMNTGSTSRGTSIPGETVDFDVVIRLDEVDIKKQDMMKNALDLALPGTFQDGATAQWRRIGVLIEGTPVDIDVTFTHKPEVQGIPSHSMAERRLKALDQQTAIEADYIRANIVFAKQILKKAGVYKKLDGGIGGIGVENWILQSGGSFERARTEFLAAAWIGTKKRDLSKRLPCNMQFQILVST